jgi:hypothetical protein
VDDQVGVLCPLVVRQVDEQFALLLLLAREEFAQVEVVLVARLASKGVEGRIFVVGPGLFDRDLRDRVGLSLQL